jgi:hypothetical protein
VKAAIFSVGEPTTDLCRWSLERNGFEVILFQGKTSLADKLRYLYDEFDEDIVRVDADVIVNRNFTPNQLKTVKESMAHIWWWQFTTFDWYKLDIAYGGANLILKEALPDLRANVELHKDHIRPETMLSRLPEFHNPRRFETWSHEIMGIHGYGIKDIKPVIQLKSNRGQSHHYDFEMTSKLNQL